MVIYLNKIEFDIINTCSSTISYILSRFSEFVKYVTPKHINYIELLNNDEGYIYINKEGEDKNQWNYTTLQILDLLHRLGFNAMLSDQDYGYIDVIVLNEIW